ncbi:MAG: WbqC family protein [Bacteroidaceae bacterium]|nr:WbqC family protein [Bacteroidaceae bacterium]
MRPIPLLSSAYLAPVRYFVRLYDSPLVVIETCDNYVKQTYRNRCLISGPNGVQALTVPIEKPSFGKSTMRDIRISDHGNWRHQHWNALQSNYERSPFFEFYADDLRPFYEHPVTFLFDFNEGLQQTILSLLELHPIIQHTETYLTVPPAEMEDLRDVISPKHAWQDDSSFTPYPYYQVFARKHGFLPDLSIVDLLFNMGPEARIVLKKSLQSPLK